MAINLGKSIAGATGGRTSKLSHLNVPIVVLGAMTSSSAIGKADIWWTATFAFLFTCCLGLYVICFLVLLLTGKLDTEQAGELQRDHELKQQALVILSTAINSDIDRETALATVAGLIGGKPAGAQ